MFQQNINQRIRKINLIYSRPKYLHIAKYCSIRTPRVLDVGCGGNSASEIKIILPHSRYVGVDRTLDYHNSADSLLAIDEFIQIDLNSDLRILERALEGKIFDIIILNHIIEHTHQGISLINICTRHLEPGGTIYIEWPSLRSLHLPSLRGTLNFFDDPTHVRLYSVKEIINTLLNQDLLILKAGARRNLYTIVLSLPRLMQCILTDKSPAGALWDILGFADIVIGQKKK